MVKLSDGAAGQGISVNAPAVGHEMTISSHDDNESPTTVTGVVDDVLEGSTFQPFQTKHVTITRKGMLS